MHDDSMIRDVLILQKRELEKKLGEAYINRDLSIKHIESNLIKVIIGPRRAGKSFFAAHVLNQFGSFGYVNFDDEKLVELNDYNEIINIVNSIYNNPKYLLFDEIQNLARWELFVNRLQREGYNLIITGSNSKLLSKEMATHLTGRHSLLTIFPFSFKEFLSLEKKELTENEIKEKLFSYANYGGYPEPLIKNLNYKEYLSTLFNSIIYKDVIKRFKIRSVQGIEDLASYMISNVAKEFSYNTLATVTKCKSVHTVEKYLKYLEESFIFFKLTRFSFKLIEQLSTNKKTYCIDNGFIHAKAFKISSDIGKLYENLVAIELKKLEMEGEANIYYWKSSMNEEVDFIIKHGSKIKQIIQVCYDLGDIKTKERETRSLLKASEELDCDNLLLITGGYEGEEQISWFGVKGKIKYIPLWKWLLSDKSVSKL